MDDIVLRGMARWPDVPAVFGWLSLDRRGRWRLRGETIGNTAAGEFIARNYGADDHGRWFFQNGPQRVFVSLAVAPLVLGLQPDGGLRTHTGAQVERVQRVLIDDQGNLLLATTAGAGVLDAGDLTLLADAFCDADGAPLADERVVAALAAPAGGGTTLWLRLGGSLLEVEHIASDDAPLALGFVREPAPRDGEADEACR